MTTAEVASEQRYVDRAYERLQEMVADSERWAAAAMASRESAGPLRDSLVRTSLARASELSIGDESLVFGRTDDKEKDTLYIGRLGVHDENHDPLVIDWRAPVAESFYRATPLEPLGLIRRRHIVCRGRQILRLDDELLDHPTGEHDLVLVGEGALLDALNRSRTGRMRDIVATIQAEQDRVIRAPLEGALVVQGGPGTGKTAVALHRAAYLLYTHREKLGRTGVLVVGPNPIFLRYIERVLPSLGESATLATVADLVPDASVSASEPAEVAQIKGDPRWVDVISRSAAALPRPLTQDAKIRYEGKDLHISVAASKEMVRLAGKRFRGTHNERRADVLGFVLQFLWSRWREAEPDWVGLLGGEGRRHFEEEIRTDAAFRAATDAMWPAVSPGMLVERLFSDHEFLAEAARNTFTPDELSLVRRPRGGGFTEADVALIDEASVHLGRPKQRRRDPSKDVDPEERWMIERMLDDLQESEPMIRTQREQFAERFMSARRDLEGDGRPGAKAIPDRFGYAIIDEAQGLSPMQWRMIARRCPSGSMTILGDLGQAGESWVAESWHEVLTHVRAKRSELAELTVNYRTPAEIMDLAGQVLASVAPGLKPPRSVRTTGEQPEVQRVGAERLVEASADAARELSRRFPDGKVAVVTTRHLVPSISHGLSIDPRQDPGQLLDAPVAVLAVEEARGLEFDAVVVAEPAAIIRESAGGQRALYVALTRPTQALVIVGAEDLPAGISAG